MDCHVMSETQHVRKCECAYSETAKEEHETFQFYPGMKKKKKFIVEMNTYYNWLTKFNP